MYDAKDTQEIRGKAAIELLKYKTLKELDSKYCTKSCMLSLDDINEVLLVAGEGVIDPDKLEEKDLEVIECQ